MNSNCSNSLYMRNLQEQVRKAFCYQILFWHFTVWINHCSDFKHFANSQPSALNLKSFSSSLEHLFLTIGPNNFGNKIPILGIQVHNFRWENSFHIPNEIQISFKNSSSCSSKNIYHKFMYHPGKSYQTTNKWSAHVLNLSDFF